MASTHSLGFDSRRWLASARRRAARSRANAARVFAAAKRSPGVDAQTEGFVHKYALPIATVRWTQEELSWVDRSPEIIWNPEIKDGFPVLGRLARSRTPGAS